MSNLGLVVMLNYLAGNKDSVEAFKKSLNKKISKIEIENDSLQINFDDNTKLCFRDEGQSCCEHRYMNCDDDLSLYIGAIFTNAELLPVEEGNSGSETHEIQFLKITTSNGWFKVANHNEHNGYYGGFSIRMHN